MGFLQEDGWKGPRLGQLSDLEASQPSLGLLGASREGLSEFSGKERLLTLKKKGTTPLKILLFSKPENTSLLKKMESTIWSHGKGTTIKC